MKGFVYEKESLTMEKSFPYKSSKEGWGLCNDGKVLYKSDGSNRIWILDPKTYKELRSILGEKGASHKTADLMFKYLNEN
mgnify:CR=1 FL=1